MKITRPLLLILMFCLSSVLSFSQNITLNYIIEETIMVDSVWTITNVESLTNSEKQTSIKYSDGIGRPVQTILKKGSPSEKDIVQVIIYDQFGRQDTTFLPYVPNSGSGSFRTDPVGEIMDFYDDPASVIVEDDYPFSVSIFDNSPLNRIKEQGATGEPWQPYHTSIPASGHTVKYEWKANGDNDVLRFYVEGDTLKLDALDKYYPIKVLYNSISKDEHWSSGKLNTVEEFKDKQGQVVLKRSFVKDNSDTLKVETYYVYDDFGLLRYVISPEASEEINDPNSSITFPLEMDDQIIESLCYYYEYDARKRMIIKQLPGAEPVYIVYDNRDRLVLTQDGNLRKDNATPANNLNKWLYTKYDHLNRAVLTGIVTANTVYDQAAMQTVVDNAYDGTGRKYYVDRDINQTGSLGFKDESFPKSTDSFVSDIDYLTATYYDNYSFPGSLYFNTGSNISDYSDNDGNTAYNDNLLSIVTGTKVNVLNTGTYITTTNYYDNKYRVIQSISESDWDTGTQDEFNLYEVVSNKYDFVGKILEAQHEQEIIDSSQTIISYEGICKYYDYDHMGRLKKVEQVVSGDTNGRVTLSEMEYNELGELTAKNLHAENISQGQVVNYEYNIKGWLTSINDPDDLGTDDLFGLNLYYNDISDLSALTSSLQQYNGNISGMIWNRPDTVSGTRFLKSAYSFEYDDLNRLKISYYGEGDTIASSAKFREYDLGYDLNGNIDALKRTNDLGSIIDNLTYDYGTIGNKLIVVTDGSGSQDGFSDIGNTTDYSYDRNGNMIEDLNKGIMEIIYNFINLPSEVKIDASNTVTYYYDAMGSKVRQSTIESGGNPVDRFYFIGFEYGNS